MFVRWAPYTCDSTSADHPAASLRLAHSARNDLSVAVTPSVALMRSKSPSKGRGRVRLLLSSWFPSRSRSEYPIEIPGDSRDV